MTITDTLLDPAGDLLPDVVELRRTLRMDGVHIHRS